MACCYGPNGCCTKAADWCSDRSGTIKRKSNSCAKGSLLYDSVVKWDRRLLDFQPVAKFHVDHPILCMPLSAIRFCLRTATAPILSPISAIVFPIIACFSKDPNKYLGAACWAAWKTIVFAAIICTCIFAISQSKMIILLGVFGGLGVISEVIYGYSVREHGKFDNRHDFPLQESMNETRSSLLGLLSKYFFA